MSHLIVSLPCLTPYATGHRVGQAPCNSMTQAVVLTHWSNSEQVLKTPGCHFTMLTELRRGLGGFGIWCSLLPCLKKRSLLISFHVISVQTCRWNAKYPGCWEFLRIDSHWSLLFWRLTCDVKIGWLIFPILQMLPVYIFINYVSRALLQRDDEVMCVPCAKERCQSPGH